MAALVEILLPLKDTSGDVFPAAYYDDLIAYIMSLRTPK